MRALVICILTYFAFVLRTVLPLAGEWGPYLPRVDLALLLVIVCRTGGTTGLLTAAAWGLISDNLSRGSLGIDVLTFVLVAYGTQLLAARGWMQSPLAGSALAGTSVFVTAVASSLLRFGTDQPLNPGQLVKTAGGPALATVIFVFVLCELWRWIVGRPANGPSASSAQVANRWHMLTE